MRSYHIGIACFVAQADHKWVDNLLSHHAVPGVEQAKQGVARKISMEGLVHIALVRRLVDQLAVPIARALEIATALCRREDGRLPLKGHLVLAADMTALKARIESQLAEATEVSLPGRRGRPPKRR